jgi:two-component system, LuxR family, sensor kinase FixL
VALIGGGYSAGLITLLRPAVRFDPTLSSMRDLILLMLVAAVGAALVASSYVAVMIATGLLPMKDFAAAALRYWVGDMIGIIVVAPFALVALTRRRMLRLSMETLLQLAAIIGGLLLGSDMPKSSSFNCSTFYSCQSFGWRCAPARKASQSASSSRSSD